MFRVFLAIAAVAAVCVLAVPADACPPQAVSAGVCYQQQVQAVAAPVMVYPQAVVAPVLAPVYSAVQPVQVQAVQVQAVQVQPHAVYSQAQPVIVQQQRAAVHHGQRQAVAVDNGQTRVRIRTGLLGRIRSVNVN